MGMVLSFLFKVNKKERVMREIQNGFQEIFLSEF